MPNASLNVPPRVPRSRTTSAASAGGAARKAAATARANRCQECLIGDPLIVVPALPIGPSVTAAATPGGQPHEGERGPGHGQGRRLGDGGGQLLRREQEGVLLAARVASGGGDLSPVVDRPGL